MYCKECGHLIDDDSRFCVCCGAPQRQMTAPAENAPGGADAVIGVCRTCNAQMEWSADGRSLVCPYCGRTEVFRESDALQAEKLRTQAYSEVEIERIRSQAELEKARMEHERQMQKDLHRQQNAAAAGQSGQASQQSGLSFTASFFGLFFAGASIFFNLIFHNYFEVVIGIIQIILFVYARNVEKGQTRFNPSASAWFRVAGFLLFILQVLV